MNRSRKMQIIKVGGGAAIIAVAFGIILPGFLSYIFSVWRMIQLIVTILLVAVFIVYVWNRLKPRKPDREPEGNHEE